MGLHLGWIPNEPGLRPRDFERAAPTEPAPDPVKVAALQAAQHARGLWSRLLIAVGLVALVLFGLLSGAPPATRRGDDDGGAAKPHAGRPAQVEAGKGPWGRAGGGANATGARWLQVAAHE